eukprot:11451958-Karenia_brevis.AAC.1
MIDGVHAKVLGNGSSVGVGSGPKTWLGIQSAKQGAQSWHQVAVLGPQGICDYRKQKMDHYQRVASELENHKKQIHTALHPDVETVVYDKRNLLFRRMLKDIGYDDQAVADYLVEGVKVVGNLEGTRIWHRCDKLAACSKRILWEGAKRAPIQVVGTKEPYRN